MEFYMKQTLPKSIILQPRIRKMQIESKIVKPKLVPMIINWIEGKNEKDYLFEKKYKFELLYRSSQDGFDTRTLHSKCSEKGPCLILVKSPSTKVYGGYNSDRFPYFHLSSFSSNPHWHNTNENFIFSFENDKDTKNMKISRVINTYHAIYYNNDYGFNFGYTFYMKNKYIYLTYTGNYDGNVTNSNTNTSFTPDEIEVFKVNAS